MSRTVEQTEDPILNDFMKLPTLDFFYGENKLWSI